MKRRQAIERIPGDNLQLDRFQSEIESFISSAEDQMHADELKDVYVTDHTPKVKKFNTNSESEDLQYYNYMKSLEDYK